MASHLVKLHKKTSIAIKRHMWPLCIVPPNTIEGWILLYADKVVALKEIFKNE